MIPISNHAAQRYCERLGYCDEGHPIEEEEGLVDSVKETIWKDFSKRMQVAALAMGQGKFSLKSGASAIISGGVVVTILPPNCNTHYKTRDINGKPYS